MRRRFKVGDTVQSMVDGRMFVSKVYDMKRFSLFGRKYLSVQIPWMSDKVWWNPSWCTLMEGDEDGD